MQAYGWFDCDDDDLPGDQRVFVDELRARARHWPVPPANTFAVPPDSGSGLVVCMDIGAPDEPVSLMTAGIHVSGNRLHGDRVHNQLFTLPDEATSLAIVADGSMPKLAETAAAWFEGILARPIVRHEWLRFGRVYAQEYLFADTLETLCQMFDGSRAPRWKTRWLGQGRRDGWIQVKCLGSPNRITHVRPGT